MLPDVRQTLGKYEIVEKIGEGGYSTVYRGFDPLIKRDVAIKSCSSGESETRDRFYREAEIAGNLDHPNIVRVYDLFIEDETPYLVQEFLGGEDLDDRIERGELDSFGEKLYTLIQIARGLNHAHRHGVVHRDVKPANVRVLEDGTVKILDFGIAKLVHASSDLTRAGMAVGTAAYLAPEQIRGEEAGAATDVFAFGVLAYELVTRIRPFGRETISETFFQTLHKEPEPLTAIWPGCPPELVEIVQRCLEKDPQRRYADFSEVLAALEKLRDRGKEHPASAADPIKTQLISSEMLLEHTQPLDVADVSPAVSTASLRTRPGPRTDLPLQSLPRGIEMAGTAQRSSRRSGWLAVGFVLLMAVAAWSWLPAEEIARRIAYWAVELSGDAAAPAIVNVSPPRETPSSAAETEPPAAQPTDKPVADVPAATPAAPVAAVASSSLAFTNVWSPSIRVSVDGGESISVRRGREIAVTSGEHTLAFTIDVDGYRDARSLRVEVPEGEVRSIAVPLAKPGTLTVQAHLGSPQGLVQIGTRRLLRPTPLRSVRVRPGRHRLAIFGHGDRTQPILQTVVDLRPEVEAVVTFDLENRRGPHVRERPVRQKTQP